MFNNLENSFNGMFGKIAPGMCRITMNGNIAIKCINGYKTYNVKQKRLTNVNNFCFDVDEMFFVIPTNKVKIGDIILVNGKPKCVVEVAKEHINVIDYENSEIRQIVPERHIFMGSTYFYGKIVSMFGNAFKHGKGLGNVMKMMMMSHMLGGKTNNGDNNMFSQMMAMSMFMGNKNENPFEDMFNFDFTDDSECDDEELNKNEIIEEE